MRVRRLALTRPAAVIEAIAMSGMSRKVPSIGAPRSGLVIDLVRALLGDGPMDPELLARFGAPEAVAARAEAEVRLREQDWADQGRYQHDNATIVASGRRPDIVFMGDSITEIWPWADPTLFTESRVCRGISGQTSPQILLRFHADVIALRPRAVHLLCGANDIAGNTGPTTPQRYQHHIGAMAELASFHRIRVVIGALTPSTFSARGPDDAQRPPWLPELNAWLRDLAFERGYTFLDYFAPLRGDDGGMRREFTRDGLHPNRRGYAAMRAVLDPLL